MNITEALEKGKGKAILECLPDDYVCVMAWNFHDEEVDTVFGDILVWNKTKRPVVYSFYSRTAWLPYQPEPEKCEACKEADDRKTRMTYPDDVISDHLRKFHCTCKKGEA